VDIKHLQVDYTSLYTYTSLTLCPSPIRNGRGKEPEGMDMIFADAALTLRSFAAGKERI